MSGGSSVAEHFCNNSETLGPSPGNATNKNAQGEGKSNKQTNKKNAKQLIHGARIGQNLRTKRPKGRGDLKGCGPFPASDPLTLAYCCQAQTWGHSHCHFLFTTGNRHSGFPLGLSTISMLACLFLKYPRSHSWPLNWLPVVLTD